MNTDMNTIRLLGVAQLLVIVGGVITERLLASVVRSGSISDILVDISENLTRMRISNLVALVLSFVIVVLGVLYYIVFNEQYKIIALVALGCFLGAVQKQLRSLSRFFLGKTQPKVGSYYWTSPKGRSVSAVRQTLS